MMPAMGEIYGILPAKELSSFRAVREVSTVPITRSLPPPIGSDAGGLRLRRTGRCALVSYCQWRQDMEVILTNMLMFSVDMKEVEKHFPERQLFGWHIWSLFKETVVARSR
jgi:hypothetical protein